MRAIDVVLETLAHFIKQEAGPPPGIPARIQPEFERRLVRLCEWHGLAPIVLDSLQRLALESSLSEITFKRLRELANAAGVRNERLLAALRQLVRRLQDRRVPYLLVDDPMAALTLYPRHRLRPMESLDILVPEKEWDRFIAACRTLGYRREATAPNFADGNEAMLYHQYVSPCVLPGARGVAVGVKFRLVDVGHPPGPESAWRSGKRVVRDIEAMRVSYEDQLIRSCVGFAMTGFGRLLHAVDAGRIIARRGDDLDWTRVESTARDRRFYTAFHASCQAVLDMFSFPAKARVLPPPNAVRRRLFEALWRPGRVGALEERPPGRHRYRFCFLESGTLGERLGVLKAVVAPSADWVSSFYGQPATPWLKARFTVQALRQAPAAPLEDVQWDGPRPGRANRR
jgi:hypothetical protein